MAAAVVVVAGCGSLPEGGAPAEPASAPTPAPAVSVASEQRRLAELFRGTPVIVEAPAAGQMHVVVPLEFAFDAGRAVVKRPLAAVLDHLASGLRRQPGVEVRISASSDARGVGGPLLAQDRGAATRDYLVARGVPAGRFAAPVRGAGDGVDLLVTEKR